MPKLPDPKQTYFFRNTYAPEAIHHAQEIVRAYYPDYPAVKVIVDGDYRGKDAFSIRSVNYQAELDKGTPAGDIFKKLQAESPITRRDLHPDDLQTGTIHFDALNDKRCFDIPLLAVSPLSFNAAQQALRLLQENLLSKGRVQLWPELLKALGPLEQVDIGAPVPANQKKKVPSVHCAQNILHYLSKRQQDQFVKNLQETQAERSYLVVGPSEAWRLPHLPDLLARHGYTRDKKANLDIHNQELETPRLRKELASKNKLNVVDKYVYQKTER